MLLICDYDHVALFERGNLYVDIVCDVRRYYKLKNKIGAEALHNVWGSWIS